LVCVKIIENKENTMKILIAIIFVLVGVTGCAISADNQGVDVSGHVSYEYQKSF
jgi:hypothetical protein